MWHLKEKIDKQVELNEPVEVNSTRTSHAMLLPADAASSLHRSLPMEPRGGIPVMTEEINENLDIKYWDACYLEKDPESQ